MPVTPIRHRPDPPQRLSTLARTVHVVMRQMLAIGPDRPDLDDDLEWAIAQLERVSARLDPHVLGPELATNAEGEPRNGRPFYHGGVFGGDYHPMFVRHELETIDGVMRGRAKLNLVWEGPPGCVHGGYVAYLHDCIMGTHNMRQGFPAMTGSLKVRYRKPTPLDTELNFEVRTIRRSGRKILDRSEIRAGNELLSDAEALFVLPRTPP